MRRSIAVGLLCAACFAAGIATRPLVEIRARAQEPAAPAAGSGLRSLAPPTRAQHNKALYFSIDEMRKKYQNEKNLSATHLAWDPFYRFTVMTRPYYDPPRKMRTSDATSRWDDSEMHENKTQIYIMLSGSGALALGGEPDTRRAAPDGQHSGGTLKGATIQRVQPGDWIVIPPYTWHQAQPDPGQTLAYSMCHIETRNTMP